MPEELISFDYFKKAALRSAKITAAERIAGSDKLLKLQLDLGSEARQLVAGIGKRYASEELIRKEIVIVANLEPRIIMGIESRGMLLAANSEDGPVLVVPERNVPPGAEIK